MTNKWDKTFMDIASIISTHSTCYRKKVGAVITKDNRIISIGYNGVPSNHVHCVDNFMGRDPNDKAFIDEHGEWSRLHENHAESNAILYAAKNGISVNGCTLYTTLSCCVDCAKQVLMSGIIRVIFLEVYDRDSAGINYIRSGGIECIQFFE